MVTKNIGMLLLGIYLIIIGASAVIGSIPLLAPLTSILAIAAGVCILIGK